MNLSKKKQGSCILIKDGQQLLCFPFTIIIIIKKKPSNQKNENLSGVRSQVLMPMY